MKNTRIIFLTLSATFLMLNQGCEEDDREVGTPFSKSEGLTATPWVVAETYLVDESNPSKPERNLTAQFTEGGNPLEINFDANGSFSVTPGVGLSFFPLSGTWSFDDSDAPRQLILLSTEGVTTIAPLGGPTRIVDQQLKINFAKRFCDDDGEQKAVLGYRLVFNRKS